VKDSIKFAGKDLWGGEIGIYYRPLETAKLNKYIDEATMTISIEQQ
jgi:hypothetical protein